MEETIEELEAKLKGLVQTNATARAAESKRNRIDELKAKIRSETNATRDLPHLEKLDGIRGSDFDVVETLAYSVAVRKPKPVEWKRFVESKQATTVAAEVLVRACLLYPEAAGLTEVLDEQPAALDMLLKTCAELAGQNVERILGK